MIKFEMIEPQDIEKEINGVYRVMEEIGVEMHNEEALALLKDAGCEVDGIQVKIPRKLVEECIASAPKMIEIYNREGEHAMSLGGRNTYFGPGPTCPNFIDPRSGERRLAIKQDAADAALVADALPNMDYAMSLCMIGDQTKSLADVHEVHAMVQNTTKPLCGWAFNGPNAQSIIDMCAAVKGSLAAFQEKPFFIMYCEPTTPLFHTKEAVDILIACAKSKVPCVYASGMIMGATAPITIPAAITVGLAESLTGLVIAQLVQKGAPVLCSATGGPMDMHTMNHAYGAPEFPLLNSIGAEVTHALGLPTWHTAGCTDAKKIDAQAAIEGTMDIMCAIGSGGNLVHDIGFSDLGMTGSIEYMIICDEIISMSKRLFRGVTYTDDDFAFDVIKEVGPGGNFLLSEHTMEHYGDNWYPTLGDRNLWNKWQENGGKDMTERATEWMRKTLESHKVKPLDADIKKGIDEVLEAAEKRVGE